MHEVLVNRLGGLSLPRKSVVRLTDRPDMTLDVYRGRKTTMQQQQKNPRRFFYLRSSLLLVRKTLVCGFLPAGIWCKNDVVLTLMRRDDVASTLIRRHFCTKCPLGQQCWHLYSCPLSCFILYFKIENR